MPHNHEWQSRIKAVEREYAALRQAADYFHHAALKDPTILLGDLRHREIVTASEHLEGTFVIRCLPSLRAGQGNTGPRPRIHTRGWPIF